jgi:hypothetical protein
MESKALRSNFHQVGNFKRKGSLEHHMGDKFVLSIFIMLLIFISVCNGQKAVSPSQMECLSSGSLDCLSTGPTYQGPAFGWLEIYDENAIYELEVPLGLENATLAYQYAPTNSPAYADIKHRLEVRGEGDMWHYNNPAYSSDIICRRIYRTFGQSCS